MALYMLKTGSAFTVGTLFSTIDTMVIEGSATIDNDFFDQRVWGDSVSWKSEYKAEPQLIGRVLAFHDDTVAAAVLADFSPSATGSAVTMTFVTGKTFTTNAHIHNVNITGNRQASEGVKISFDFRSIAAPSALNL